MRTPAKNVIFYCDDCNLLDPVIRVFKATQPEVVIQISSDVKDLLSKVRSSKPEMVLVYLHDPNETYVHVLKELREQVDFSSIEVIIYRTLPNDKDLEQVFKKFVTRR